MGVWSEGVVEPPVGIVRSEEERVLSLVVLRRGAVELIDKGCLAKNVLRLEFAVLDVTVDVDDTEAADAAADDDEDDLVPSTCSRNVTKRNVNRVGRFIL